MVVVRLPARTLERTTVRAGRAIALLVVACIVAGCGTPTGTPRAASSPPSDGIRSLAPTSAAAADLDRLLDRLEAIHPDPWHGVARADFVAALDGLKGEIGSMTPPEAEVAVMRLVAMISAKGRDGHMFALPADGHAGLVLPVRLYEFADGVYVTAAMAPNADLAGARLLSIAGHAIGEVLAAIEPLVPRDSPATVPAFRPVFLLRTDVLRGLGLIGDGPVQLSVDGAGAGPERTVTVTPVPFAAYVDWAGPGGMTSLPPRADTRYLEDRGAVFWWEYLPQSRTVYGRYSAVRRPDGAAVSAFAARAAEPDVDRVVLDLRQNPGGDNRTYAGLLSAIRSPAIDRAGHLFVLIDRVTFSAAANLATEIEQSTGATFAGEPMGGGLNFWDDVTWVDLPDLPVPMRVGVSRLYWQMSTADDPRLTIDPQLAEPVTAADYFAGVDPALAVVVTTDVNAR
jgi:hypothetical protein